MSKRIRFFTLWLTAAAFPAFAQDHADTLHVCTCSANIAAFDLPWLAKYYGLDWKTDSLTAAQSAAGSLAKAEAERLSAGKAEDADSYTLSLRANLLRWATLTPDLGLEWRICPSWGIAVNGSWGHCRKRLVDFMELERQGPPLRPLGSGSGSTLLYG